MAFWDGLTASFGGSLMSNLLLGAAAVVVAPIVVPAVLAGVRPVAKTLIKGGVYVYGTARGMVAEAGEQLGDLVAEAHAELTTSTPAPQQSASQA
jgi:Protein of unknown function (DUF5132)